MKSKFGFHKESASLSTRPGGLRAGGQWVCGKMDALQKQERLPESSMTGVRKRAQAQCHLHAAGL